MSISLKIIPGTVSEGAKQLSADAVCLGDNSCLPGIVADTFGWQAVTLECTDEHGPVFTFGACMKAKKIVMLPHFSYGPTVDPAIAREVISAIKTAGYSCEWRLTSKASEFTFTDKVTTLLPLNAGSERQFELLSPNVRRKIRKCASNGIEIRTGKSELLSDFYGIYSRNMHSLGSPALPRRWFAALLEKYRNGQIAISCAYLHGKPIGSACMLEYNGFYEACWFSTLKKHNSLYTSYGLYWEMIRIASEQDGKYFSFGRSTAQGGVHQYKQQWGGIDIPLVWNYSHPQGRNIRSFKILTKLWKLLPYSVARIIGPELAGGFY